jgi:hypothetical protein
MDASFPPFEFWDGEGNLVGFDVDLGREIAARLGVRVEFVANLSYDGLYDALAAEQVDVVISALYVDPTRMADFAYSPRISTPDRCWWCRPTVRRSGRWPTCPDGRWLWNGGARETWWPAPGRGG